MSKTKNQGGTIYKQKDSEIWTLNFKPKGKKRIRKSSGTSSKRKAWVELEKLINSIEDGSYYEELSTTSFEDLSIAYIKEGIPLLKENTQNDYMLYILRFHKIIGDKKAINIVKEDIQSFVDWIRGKGLSASSIQNHLAAISAVFTYGVKTGVIEDNPVRKFDKSYVGKSKERIRFLIKDEYKLLLENCSYELLQQAMILAVETGLRKSELMSLKWSDQIDFRKKEITVFYTKNKKHRTIPISPIAFEVLKIIYKNKKKYERLNNKICDYVFFNFNTWKRIKSFKKSFATAKKRADIEDFRWHDFRHTFATWGLKGWFTWQKYPMDLYKLQRWLGHSDIKTTQRYAHLEIQDLHSLIDYSVVIQWEGVKWSEIKIRKSQYKTL